MGSMAKLQLQLNGREKVVCSVEYCDSIKFFLLTASYIPLTFKFKYIPL
jgi:hypothetical protein